MNSLGLSGCHQYFRQLTLKNMLRDITRIRFKLPVLKVCVGNMKFPITFGTKSNPISSRIFFVVNLYFLSCLNRKQSLVCIFMNFPFASFIKPWNYNTNSMIKHIARYYILKIIEQSFSYL